jgi:structural maintenance of chromosome 4
MKPKAANEHDDGLLEYLEDIVGTSKYKSPIEESAVEVETLNEVCVEKSNRVEHVEKEKNGLEEKKNKALAYIRDENELATKQSALYQIYVEECGDNLQVTEEAIGQIQAQLDEEMSKHEGNEEGIKQLQKQYKKGSKEHEAMETDTQAVLKEMAKFERENVKFEEKKKFLAGKQKKLEKTQQTSRFAASESENTISNCADDVQRHSSTVGDLEKTRQSEERELGKIRECLKGKTQSLSDQIAAKQKSLEPWSTKIAGKESAIAVAESELEILRERSNAGAVALQEAQAKNLTIEENREARRNELEECRAERKKLEKDAAKLQTSLDKMSKEESERRSHLSGARQKADEARASLSNSQAQGNVLTGLMRLKESGRIDGFHGRLGNLGAIDQKYDVAISTACPSLDNIIVDTVEVGQQCIDYLRKNNLGRANFICLDRLAQRDLSSVLTPENVPRLFDLVKSKHQRFLPAFYSVLQNTLVAIDLAQANRIAYGAKRWRVVTLDGQLIDKSGTMTGGGTRVVRGGMSSKLVAETSKEQVAKLEIDREALEQEFKQFQERQQELENSLRNVNERIPLLDTKMQKLGLEVDSLGKKLMDSQKRCQELENEQQPSKSDNSQVASLEKKIVTLRKDLQRLHSESAGLNEEIKALQDKIMEIGGVQLRSQKAKVDGLREQIDTLNDQISSAEVNKTKAEKLKIKHEKAQVDAEAELRSVAKDLDKLENDAKNQRSDVSEFKQRVEDAQEVMSDAYWVVMI